MFVQIAIEKLHVSMSKSAFSVVLFKRDSDDVLSYLQKLRNVMRTTFTHCTGNDQFHIDSLTS